MRLDGKTTTELADSSGFEFNTTRPRSQCALEYNTSWSQSVIKETSVPLFYKGKIDTISIQAQYKNFSK